MVYYYQNTKVGNSKLKLETVTWLCISLVSFSKQVSHESNLSFFTVAIENNMASQPSGSRRLSASKALEFLNNLMDDSSEDSDSDDIHNVNNLNKSSDTDRSRSDSSDNDSDLDFDVNEAGPSTSASGTSRSRKRPHTDLDVDNSGDNEPSRSRPRLPEPSVRSQPGSRSRPNTRPVVEWNEVTNGEGVHFPAFRFVPPRAPGVSPPLTHESTPLDCFTQLFNNNIKDKLRDSINDFAAKKVRLNTPARRYLVYANWEPISDSEMYKLLAVICPNGP